MTAATKTTARKQPRRAKPTEHVQEIAPDQQTPENAPEASESDSLAEDLSGAHPDGEAELARLDAEMGYDEPEAARSETVQPEQPGGAGWSAIQSAGLLHMAFAAVAAGRGAHWVLQDKEAEMLGQSMDKVLDKYFPDGPGKYGPEIALFSAALMVVAPRMAIDVKALHEEGSKQVAEEVAGNDDVSAYEVSG